MDEGTGTMASPPQGGFLITSLGAGRGSRDGEPRPPGARASADGSSPWGTLRRDEGRDLPVDKVSSGDRSALRVKEVVKGACEPPAPGRPNHGWEEFRRYETG